MALVGTRRATDYGREVAQSLAIGLARAGVTVVSGLAKGIDTIAHRAAIRGGGRTIAALGNGLDQIYPPQNLNLAKAIVDTGQGSPSVNSRPASYPAAAVAEARLGIDHLADRRPLAYGAPVRLDAMSI